MAMEAKNVDSRPTSLNILKKHFLKVRLLKDYLKDRVSSGRYAKLQRVALENEGMRKLIETAYVCANPTFHILDDDGDISERSILSIGDHATQTEVVHRVLRVMLTRRGGTNVLCQGYEEAKRDRSTQPTSLVGPGFVNVYPNHRVAEVKSARWVVLFQCLGEEHMIELLLNNSIFLDLKHDYFTQLTGTGLGDLSILPSSAYSILNEKQFVAVDPKSSKHSRKRKRAGHHRPLQKKQKLAPSENSSFLKSPNSIVFARSRMFYSRAPRSVRGTVIFGLRKEHVLNRCNNVKDEKEARHIMKYMFPKQFGLHSVFTHATDRRETTHAFKDYTDREAEIMSSSKERVPKAYKRLEKKLVPLIQRMQRLHSQCSYHSLINYYCSEASDGTARNEVEFTESPETSRLLTQMEISTSSGRSFDKAVVPASKDEDIIRHHLPQYRVIAFVTAVVKSVIPKSLFGSEQNRSIILKHIALMVKMRRFDSISLHTVMQGIKIADIDWLAPNNIPNTSSKLSLTDFQKRTELFSEFLYWLFDSFVIHLIRTNFYVTETAVHKNRVFYFRHDVWRAVSTPSIDKLRDHMWEELSKDEARLILSRRTRKNMGYSFVRLLPKETGVRCITNLKRKAYRADVEAWQGKGPRFPRMLGQSINKILEPVFSILNFEKTRDPSKIGNAMFSAPDMYPKLQEFQKRRMQKGWTFRPLYFARVDIKGCFDNINQEKILEIIKDRVVKSDEYMLHKYCEIKHNHGRVIKNYNMRATATDGLSYTENFGEERAKTTFHRVLVEKILPTFIYKDDAIPLLEEHITNNILKMGKKFYRQKVGIPQGSVVSTLLCNILYADLEKEELPFVDSDEGLLLRLIDDFLFISMNRNHAKQFLQYMHGGFPEYGCSVNMAKSLANFDVTIHMQRIPRLQGTTLFPFCGSLIDTQTLDVFKDASRMEGLPIMDTLKVERAQNPGKALIVKTLNTLKLGGHAMFVDTKFNSLITALTNVYINFTTTAMKMHNHIRCLETRPPEKLVQGLINEVISLQYTLTRSHLKVWPGSSCAVTENQVKWLGAMAFYQTLQVKQTGYKESLKWLKEMIESSKGGKLQRSMERIVSRHSISKRMQY